MIGKIICLKLIECGEKNNEMRVWSYFLLEQEWESAIQNRV